MLFLFFFLAYACNQGIHRMPGFCIPQGPKTTCCVVASRQVKFCKIFPYSGDMAYERPTVYKRHQCLKTYNKCGSFIRLLV